MNRSHIWYLWTTTGEEVYLTDISLSCNIDLLYLFVQHSLCMRLFFFSRVRLDTRKASCFTLTAALWLEWDTSGGKGHSSLLDSNWVCSEIISECKCTAQNKKDHKHGIGRGGTGKKCPVKANSPRGLRNNEDYKIFLGIHRTLQSFCKSMSHWKVLEWEGALLKGHSGLGKLIFKHPVLNCQIQKI